jgi:hypothetical protein
MTLQVGSLWRLTILPRACATMSWGTERPIVQALGVLGDLEDPFLDGGFR